MKKPVKRQCTIVLLLLSVLFLSQCCVEAPVVNNWVIYDDPVVEDGSFTMVSDEMWNETAVRKVLHLFAYAGFPDDQQITAWADMDPGSAIVEMIILGSDHLSTVGGIAINSRQDQ